MNDISKKILKNHAKTFYFAGLLLKKHTLDDAAILYTFCRQLDDAVDKNHKNSPKKQLKYLVTDYRNQVSIDPVNLAFKKIQKKYCLNQKFVDDLIDGISSDINFKQPKSLRQLIYYSYQVAGTVGGMMAKILGANNKNAWKFAVDLGIGMQLTNISRDVKEDSLNKRIYIPKDMLPQSFSPQDISTNRNNEIIFTKIKEILEIAENYYKSGLEGIFYIPNKKNKFSILIAAQIYNKIGKKIIKNKFLFLKKRVYINVFEKIYILMKNYLIQKRKCKLTEPIHKTNQLHKPYFTIL